MSLELFFHPLSSFCQKALIALYENDTKFEGKLVNLMDPAERDAYRKIWPVGKFPVLRDGDRLVPESSTIIEYLDAQYSGRTRFVPADATTAAETRKWDRLFDLYLDMPLGKIVTDRMRPAGKNDPIGVEEARRQLGVGLDLTEKHMAGKPGPPARRSAWRTAPRRRRCSMRT